MLQLTEMRWTEGEQDPRELDTSVLWSRLKYNLVFKIPITGRPVGEYALADNVRARLEKAANKRNWVGFMQELRRFHNTRGEIILVGDEVSVNDYPSDTDTISVGGHFYRIPDIKTSKDLDPLLVELQKRISS